MRTKMSRLAALALAGTLALSACAPGQSGSPSGGDSTAPVNVGIIYSQTGLLAAYGETYRQGLEAGLAYATDGTNKVNDREVKLNYLDDGGDPEKAVTHAKNVIGEGTKIIGGTASSGIALKLAEQAGQNKVLYLAGPAATDAVTGINKYTFRTGRQTYQDVATSSEFVPAGGKVLVFAQDTTFGQGNVAAVQNVYGAKGTQVLPLLVPEDATEFTPFARQIIDAKPDLVFVAWAGSTTAGMWQALSQQGVLDQTKVVTGLGDISSYGAYGPASEKISFLSHYFSDCCQTDVNKQMVDAVQKNGGKADLFTPDGFVAGQMLARAIEEGADDPDKMVQSLEGWSFEGPKGQYTVRAGDHALLQPMFQAKLVKEGDTYKPELVKELPADQVAPPEKQ